MSGRRPAVDTSGVFTRRLSEKASQLRIPLIGTVEVTARCNLGCRQCYINVPADDRHALDHELKYPELVDLLDQIADEGCVWLTFTGGEPFLRPDFLETYNYAKRRGLLVTLLTNGTLIDRRVAEHLAKQRPLLVEVSLYGASEVTYERVTGVPGSFRRCLRGIELLVERGLAVRLKSAILTLNCHEIGGMRALAEKLGLSYRFDPVLNLRIDGGRAPAEFRLSPEAVVQLDLADARRLEELSRFSERFAGVTSATDCLYQCGAGLNAFHIDPYGRLGACLMARAPTFDLRRGSFREGWYDFMPQLRALRATRQTPCRNCALVVMCGQCPGWAYMELGDPEAPVRYLCRIARLRAQALGLDAGPSGGPQ